jgi:hypothetical protein
LNMPYYLSLQRTISSCVVLLFVLLLLPAHAQNNQHCFPETGYCIEGRIRDYWEQNGGLLVFGYPIGPQQEERIEGRPVQAQWFERNRLELHPENDPPYDVLLGRLGAEALAHSGLTPAPQPPQDGCIYFEQTGFNVCGEIFTAWQANGLDLGDPGTSHAESLALFGLPVSGEMAMELADGNTYTVQWFERGRFERHPENDPPYHVLLGLLGNEMREREQPAPLPIITPTPVATPVPGNGDGDGTIPQAESDWSVVDGVPNTIDLQDVFLLNEREAWLVGNDPTERGVVYRALWDGANWSIDKQFATTERLNALVVISANNIWAVGDQGLIIHNDPQSGEWSYIENPVPHSDLQTIQMFGAGETGFAGGSRSLGEEGNEVVLLRYANGQWQRVDVVSGAGFITSMHFAPGTGWAVGSEVWRYRDASGWGKDDSLGPPCEGDSRCYRTLDGVRAISAEEAWVVGSGGAYCMACAGGHPSLLHYVNGAWQQHVPIVGLPEITHIGQSRGLNGVSFADNNHGIAVGVFIDPLRAERNEPVRQGLILRYLDGTWYYEPAPPVETHLHRVSMADAQHALAVGDNGVLLSYGYGK